ncbi:MAG: rhodanese-like domain-containing protein [Propionibacteriaceae bacterium]|uniref:Rhodanese-like domain n=1 Tax=Propionibacterium ruminifibrarum TaxID=1962131 RepID=A0A375I3B8_9ACTN|nr:rhodanese-like domain-containing protein [Propionibacterium ruminifibrarum]MBE6476651.1 rhodanese-like domain-containing protein [Propionibacteriaceae bacterium]SPF67790.1 Rhodanese-like domain [Propionibacterium ruminifibrarum]
MGWLRRRKDDGGGAPAEGNVDVTTALHAMASGAVVIDVRARREYERGHMPGARLVDPRDLAASPVDAIWGDDPLAETSKPIIVVSSTGSRAAAAARVLREGGFDALVLAGGLVAWARDGQVLIPGPPR